MLPTEIFKLEKLDTLDVSNNCLSSLPPTFAQLSSLRTLSLRKNQLVHFGQGEIGQLTNLETLDVRNNHLESLPISEILNLPHLKGVSCQGNSSLFDPPREIANQGGEAVLGYLRLVAWQTNATLNMDIELIVIGKGESGKTSVINALMQGKSHRIHEDQRTVGIDLSDWKV